MKISFLSILLISFSLSASTITTQDPTTDFQPQAQEWAEKVLNRVDRIFIPDLLEFLHASYMRSYMTLIVQREYMNLFGRIGSGWNHIISTRLDPSKDETFDATAIAIDQLFLQQLESFQKNCVVQKKYVELLNRLADDTHADYPAKNNTADYRPCRLLIDGLRENARTAVADSLITAIDEIQQEIQKAQEMISQAAQLFKNEGQLKSNNFLNRSITELLWYYVPHFMVKSFVNFDKGYTQASKQCLDAYLESQQIGNEIWHRIEIARASYYAAHYHALYTLVQKTSPELISPEHPTILIQQLTDYTCLT
jgi:hypothetical protein